MSIIEEVKGDWYAFVTKYCLGIEPAEPREDVVRAFDALHRLYPEYLEKFESNPTRGLLATSPAISLGLTLAKTEALPGFAPVLGRVRNGEDGATAELDFAAMQTDSGLTPELEPLLGSNKLDTLVKVSGQNVFAEVIAPERSAAALEAQAAIGQVAQAILPSNAGVHTEVLLSVEPEPNIDAIVATAAAVPISGEVVTTPIGLVYRVPLAGPPLDVSPRIPNPDPRPVVAVGRGNASPNQATSVTIRLPLLDERAHKLLSRELHHFSRSEANILVVRVTSSSGIKWWSSFVNRWFQPTRNRRVGAVVLYEQGLLGTPLAIRRRWHIVVNPHAYVKVPQELLDRMQNQSDPCWGGSA